MVTFDPDRLRARQAELEQELGQPGFWDDQQHAAAVSAEHARVARRVERYDRLTGEYDDAKELLELDPSLAGDVATSIVPLRNELERLQEDALFSGEYDSGDAVVSIQADAGGTDSQDWAEMLLRMYIRWAERKGYKLEELDRQPGDEAGIKSATIGIEGEWAYGWCRAEAGVHRLVRISPYDANARRHTSFASVFVYPDIDETIKIEIDEKDLRIDKMRSGGAGGQHVNKTESAVRVTHLPTGIAVHSDGERSQHKNLSTAMRILRSKLFELEEKKREERMGNIHAQKKAIEWGSQIRSYVLAPYRLTTDHRTGLKVGNVDAVLDGDLDQFMVAMLLELAGDPSAIAGGGSGGPVTKREDDGL